MDDEMVGYTCPDCGQSFDDPVDTYLHMHKEHEVDQMTEQNVIGLSITYATIRATGKQVAVFYVLMKSTHTGHRRVVPLLVPLHVATQISTLVAQFNGSEGPYQGNGLAEMESVPEPSRPFWKMLLGIR